MKNEYDEEITGTIEDGNGYGEKIGKCNKCGKEIIVNTDWLTEAEESIVYYNCPHCSYSRWNYF